MPYVFGDRPSILPPAFYGGLMFISGWPGLGKTTLALQADVPNNIAMFDLEDKGASWDEQLNLGLYCAPVSETGGRDYAAVWRAMSKAFDALEQDRYTVVILDNITTLEEAIGADVANNPKDYGDRYGYSVADIKNDRFGKARSCVNKTIAEIVARLHAKGVKLVIAIAHLGDFYQNGQAVPNKKKVRGRSQWQRLSVLTLILGKGDNPPIPSAMVQKEQLGEIVAPDLSDPEVLEAIMKGESGHVVRRRLPQRMPECTFQRLRWYLAHPANLVEPAEGEEVRADEVAVFSEALTNAQLQFVVTTAQAAHDAFLAEQTVNAMMAAPAINPLLALSKGTKKSDELPPAVQSLVDRIKELRDTEENLSQEEIEEILRGEGAKVPMLKRAFAAL